ncbi:MAG: metallophosphoesterase [Actinomycetia bacterium]|nr:metallophosphoesterase [Actinomycetes bacterium]
MQRIVMISDLHLKAEAPEARLDNLVETQFKKLEFVYTWAYENDAIICQAGDYVDKPRSWYLLPLLTAFLAKWKALGVKTYMVRGQHDTYYYSEASGPATVIGSLAAGGFLTILDEDPVKLSFGGKTAGGKIVKLYGASFGQAIPVPAKYLPGNVLITHREISDKALFEGHKYYNPKGFLKRHQNFKVILCGDIHRKFQDKLQSSSKDRLRYIMNSGPMLRLSATTYNFDHKPGFYVWEPYNKISWISIPHEKAETVLTRSHIEKQEAEDRAMAEFTLMLTSKGQGTDEQKYSGNYRSDLDEYIQGHKISKDISSQIYSALADIDINDL